MINTTIINFRKNTETLLSDLGSIDCAINRSIFTTDQGHNNQPF